VLSQQTSSRKDPDDEREVFRSAGSAILSWAWFVVTVIVLVDLAVQGRDHTAVVAAAAVLAITGVVYSCAWRPRIVADTSGITVINPVRDHQVPWAAVTKVDVLNAVRVHCAPAPGAARGKILYSWAVQSSPRSARKAALRRKADDRLRPRLTPRPRSAQPPPGAVPRYGEIPEPARDALDRSSAEFTAGRLAERAQHAHQAAARAAGPPAAGEHATAWPAGTGDGQAVTDGQTATSGQPAANGRSAAPGPDGRPVAAGLSAGDGQPVAGAQPAAGLPVAQGLPAAQWAWLSIAAMIVPLAVLLLVLLV
jgi:Bacterial PH domain